MGATDHNPVQRSCAGMGCLSRMRAEGTLLWCWGGSEGRTVGTLAIYLLAQARHNYVVPGYDQGCRFAALRCFGSAQNSVFFLQIGNLVLYLRHDNVKLNFVLS